MVDQAAPRTTPALRRALPWAALVALRRALPWAALVALLVVAQTLLVLLTISYEDRRAQERVDDVAAQVAASVKREFGRSVQALLGLVWSQPKPASWSAAAAELLRQRPLLLRVERRSAELELLDAVDAPMRAPLFSRIPRAQMTVELEIACTSARRADTPQLSRSYFVPQPGGLGMEVMDLCVRAPGGEGRDLVVATVALAPVLEDGLTPEQARDHEFSFVEGDGTRLARAGIPRGRGVYVAQRVVDLPGAALQLRADSAARGPSLIPNLATALVLGLSFTLFGVVMLLLRDVRKRARAEAQLADALAFRRAMEDSLVTGLRARDRAGRITYVNAAFCQMVGFSAEELMSQTLPPYWPPELVDEYKRRQRERLASTTPGRSTEEGYETVFVRRGGERFPVMIYEAPLVDRHGQHTGWMSAVLDMSAQRRVEELSRQQQERLQATARLATVGEMASLLSHELNQPLAAIASYASGSLNLLSPPQADPDKHTLDELRQALRRIADQAERAGRVIKSVHDVVRRREQAREPLSAQQLVDAILPLARLQARKSGTRIDVQVAPGTPRVLADRTMVEQVLLNLTRNGIQAMEEQTPLAQRQLQLFVRPASDVRWVAFSVTDAGPGIAPDVADRLFTPFFTTRSEGMGLGLSLCRTVVEQHGGALDFHAGPGGRGTEFVFTLPAADTRRPITPPMAVDGAAP